MVMKSRACARHSVRIQLWTHPRHSQSGQVPGKLCTKACLILPAWCKVDVHKLMQFSAYKHQACELEYILNWQTHYFPYFLAFCRHISVNNRYTVAYPISCFQNFRSMSCNFVTSRTGIPKLIKIIFIYFSSLHFVRFKKLFFK